MQLLFLITTKNQYQNLLLNLLWDFLLYILVFIIISCLLGSLGLDFMTSLSGAASAIGNVGPGLGEMIGPNGTYAEIPNLGKLILCLGMILED